MNRFSKCKRERKPLLRLRILDTLLHSSRFEKYYGTKDKKKDAVALVKVFSESYPHVKFTDSYRDLGMSGNFEQCQKILEKFCRENLVDLPCFKYMLLKTYLEYYLPILEEHELVENS